MTDTLTAPVVAAAPVPSRSTGSLTLGFGLVSIPVAVYAGTEDGGIQRHEYVRTETGEYTKVGRQSVIKVEDGTPEGVKVAVEPSKVVKLYETQGGAQVELSDAEIATAVGEFNGSGKVLTFQPLSLLGSYVTESVMQVRPAKRGSGRDKTVDPIAERAFALLMQGMEAEQTFAVVRYVMRGKVRFATLTPDGVMRSVRFAGEVREALPLPEVTLTEPEQNAARLLINSIRTDAPLTLTDEATAKVDAYASSKAATGTVAVEAPEAPVHSDFSALMEALAKSVSEATAARTAV